MYFILGEIDNVNNRKYYVIIESEKSFIELDFDNLPSDKFGYIVPIYSEKDIDRILKFDGFKKTNNEKELNNPIECKNFPYRFGKKKYKINFKITKLIELRKIDNDKRKKFV